MTLKDRITRHKDGSILFRDSFMEYDDEYVGNVFADLLKDGTLVRLSQGVYYKPVHTRLGILYPAVSEVITAIAKRDHATILPTGNTAMYHLGLTTQVPMNYEYLTNGAARQVTVGKHTITLKHGVANNFAFRGKLMPVLHQALRAIGQENVTDEHKGQIAALMVRSPEPQTIMHDLKLLPVWERSLVKPLIPNN